MQLAEFKFCSLTMEKQKLCFAKRTVGSLTTQKYQVSKQVF